MDSFVAYCDESYTAESRYRGVAAVSLRVEHEGAVCADLKAQLASSSLREFKWSKLVDARGRFAAEKLVSSTLRAVDTHDLRVDVLIWDVQDRRHSVRGRDDNANYERMCFQLLKSVLRRRVRGSQWHVFPDEKLGVDWQTLQDCLHAVGRRPRGPGSLFAEFLRAESYSVRRLLEVKSHEQPLGQLADFFCGLSVFSRLKFSAYSHWASTAGPQRSLFDTPPVTASRSDQQRFQVLRHFKQQAEAARLGVSLDSSGGLRTLDPSRPVNFWWYEPQHGKDRAPTKAHVTST